MAINNDQLDHIAESPAAKCDWCGRENKDRLPNCLGCGTVLAREIPPAKPDVEKKEKSRGTAVLLALIFGPLGLIYVDAWGIVFLLILITLPFLLSHTGGLAITIGVRILCAGLAYGMVSEHTEKPDVNHEALRLLEEAARMESVDRAKAVAAYEEIIRLYPNSSATEEATRNIQTLTRKIPA